ncbi:lipoprotein insertase outer membrane protein LolB [Thalassotalea piscium]
MNESRYSSVFTLTCVKYGLKQRICSCSMIIMVLLISSCSSTPDNNNASLGTNYTLKNRTSFLTTINNWQVKGKIAFIEGKEKKSASLFWQNHPRNQSEQLKLTTYLGINVLDVNLNNGIYTVNVDKKTYKDTDIDYILYSLSGFHLPSKALKSWIKAIPFTKDDKIQYDSETQLPVSITSHYANTTWKIRYNEYDNVNTVPLPKRLTIKQNNLTIKIIINQWTF